MIWYVFLVILIASLIKSSYELVKLNEHNGMFYYAVFGLYLKEKGLSDEEIEKERMKWARHSNHIHKLLWPKLYHAHFTEDKFRGDIVKLMKALNIK